MLLLVERVQAEKVLLVDGSETSQVSSVKAGRIFLLVSRSGLAGGSFWWQSLARMGVAFNPIPQTLGFFPLGCGSSTGGIFGTSAGEEVVELFSTSGMATPQKTSSSVKVRYHFTSSLSSDTLFTNKQGSPPVGRSFSSAQYWRALAYTTTFFPRDFSYVPTGKN